MVLTVKLECASFAFEEIVVCNELLKACRKLTLAVRVEVMIRPSRFVLYII